MSGGSRNYIFLKLEEECAGCMYDEELNDLINDLCDVLHDLEWWDSGDIDEEQYRKTVSKFKKKWFNTKREPRVKSYIDTRIEDLRKELYHLIGASYNDI